MLLLWIHRCGLRQTILSGRWAGLFALAALLTGHEIQMSITPGMRDSVFSGVFAIPEHSYACASCDQLLQNGAGACVCVSMSINSELLQLRAFDAPNPSFSPKRDGEPSAWPIRSFSLLPAADVSNLLFYFCIFSASGAAGDFSPRSLQDSNPIKLKHFAHLFPSARLVLSRPPAA